MFLCTLTDTLFGTFSLVLTCKDDDKLGRREFRDGPLKNVLQIGLLWVSFGHLLSLPLLIDTIEF